MNRRQRDILNYILNAEAYITGNELARICSVTLRTVRSDVVKINEALKKYNVNVDSATPKGYFLSHKSKEILIRNNVIRKIIDNAYIAQVPTVPEERQSYIIIQLINNEHITSKKLAEALYVSEATINSDVAAINKYLKENLKIKISISLSRGFSLNADEKDKRNLISLLLSKK